MSTRTEYIELSVKLLREWLEDDADNDYTLTYLYGEEGDRKCAQVGPRNLPLDDATVEWARKLATTIKSKPECEHDWSEPEATEVIMHSRCSKCKSRRKQFVEPGLA